MGQGVEPTDSSPQLAIIGGLGLAIVCERGAAAAATVTQGVQHRALFLALFLAGGDSGHPICTELAGHPGAA